MSEVEALLSTALTGDFVHQPPTPVPEWLTKYTDEAARFAPLSKRIVAVAVTNETGVYVFAGRKTDDAWAFTFLATHEHVAPWTWGIQVDYRW
jgi:hypothetical protein